MKKGKILACLISFAMAFFIIIKIPTPTNAQVMPTGLDMIEIGRASCRERV